MTRKSLLTTCVVVALAFASVGVVEAQVKPAIRSPGEVTRSARRASGFDSPMPPALASGRRIFVSNGGADAGLFPHPFTGTQDRGYGELYTLLEANSAITLASAPTDADLVLDLHLNAPLGSLGGDKQSGTEDPLPSFKLVIYDRPTHYVLWTMAQTIDRAALQRTHDKNFDDALALLAAQFFAVTGTSK